MRIVAQYVYKLSMHKILHTVYEGTPLQGHFSSRNIQYHQFNIKPRIPYKGERMSLDINRVFWEPGNFEHK